MNLTELIAAVTGLAVVLPVLAACDPGSNGLPKVYETEHLRVGAELGHPLCAGDLEAYEAVVSRVESELGVSMGSKFDVSIWPDDVWPSVAAEYCSGEALGCTDYRRREVFSSASSVTHELVHAATPYPELTPFFAEGLADVYSGHQSRFGNTAPSDSLDLPGGEMDRWAARHFIRWLRETWGPAKLGDLIRHEERAGENFKEVFGLSFGEAQEQFFREAPFGYQGLDTCGGALIEPSEDAQFWGAAVSLDCAIDEDVRAIELGLTTYRTFHIPVAGYYSVSTDAFAITLSRCARGAVQEPVRNQDYFDADVPPSYSLDLTENYATYEGGSIRELYFEEGEHQIGLLLLGHEPGEASLAIWSTLGPHPVGGNG